jgi:NTF2-related export protein 1/2
MTNTPIMRHRIFPPQEPHYSFRIPAAKNFVEWYYRQVNESKPVTQSYVNGNATYDKAGHPPADICINGLLVATPQEWEKLLAQQRVVPSGASLDRKAVRYEVECYDVHVINSDYRFAAPQKLIDIHAPNDGVRMMMMLTVSGSIYFGASSKSNEDYAIKQHFNDVFILIPNWDIIEKPGAKFGRKYLVASHTYRAY